LSGYLIRVASDKHSSLFIESIRAEEKRFYGIGTKGESRSWLGHRFRKQTLSLSFKKTISFIAVDQGKEV